MIRARQLGENDAPEKTALYEIKESRTVVFEEQQERDGSVDQVNLCYQLSENETGYFSKEFRPPNMQEKGTKKIDITAAVQATEKKQTMCYLYDVKDTFGGSDVLVKLWAQWNSGWENLQEKVVRPSGCEWKYQFGVFTRKIDEERIERELNLYKEACESIEQNNYVKIPIALRKKKPDLARCRKYCEVDQAILDRQFWLADHVEQRYGIDIQMLSKEGENTYKANFKIEMR